MKNLIYISLIILSYIFSGTSFADVLEGRIMDAKTGMPLAGANIVQMNSINGTMSDQNGKFKLNCVSECSAEIRIISPGYITEKILLSADQKSLQKFKISLKPSMLPGKEIVITEPNQKM